MQHMGDQKTLEWEGKLGIVHNQLVVLVENKEGHVVLAVGCGKIVPENWVGERVKITVHKTGDSAVSGLELDEFLEEFEFNDVPKT